MLGSYPMKQLSIRGARQNNLKHVDIDIPRAKLTVITGLSGSGKSSLAFDTIYAEGQRRYVESLSVRARQLLEQLARPEVDTIEGLSPAICIEQRPLTRSPRSTVATVTEIADYLRLLFAKTAKTRCISCNKAIERSSIQEMVAELYQRVPKRRLCILAPIMQHQHFDFTEKEILKRLREMLEKYRKDGYTRAEVNNKTIELADEWTIRPASHYTIHIYIDRLILKEGSRSRLADSLELATSIASGVVRVKVLAAEEEPQHDLYFTESYRCYECDISYPERTPQLFSFNSPIGACPHCNGLGVLEIFDKNKIINNPQLSIAEGAIAPWQGRSSQRYADELKELASEHHFSLVKPFADLEKKEQDLIFNGDGKNFIGILEDLNRRYQTFEKRKKEKATDETFYDELLRDFQRYMRTSTCPHCRGTRLRKEALATTLAGKTIADIFDMSIIQASTFFETLEPEKGSKEVAEKIIAEIKNRLEFLKGVGVGYLGLKRATSTLSGGEGQRVRLATQIGSALVGVLYILDEPSIGLHQRDHSRLLQTLEKLVKQYNTVIVVEHDLDTIRHADYIVDLGPGAGILGGEIVAQGHIEDIMRAPKSLTGAYISGRRQIDVPKKRRKTKRRLRIVKAQENNLRSLNVDIPLNSFVCVTGVSGSGKSTLIMDTLLPALRRELHHANTQPGRHQKIEGIFQLDKVIAIDQHPIGYSSRANPASYTGILPHIRELFAGLKESRLRGWKGARFSFNVKGGRCEACKGEGKLRVEMHFMPDLFVECQICRGRRFNDETLALQYRGLNIADVLDLSVDQSIDFFSKIPKIKERLEVLMQVGLGYIKLGQAANTLSGGEAQRIKLARELSRRSTEDTLYILDEPTTGLHLADIDQLLVLLHRLVDQGSSVIVIEHHLDVIKTADYVIDLGPEGGDDGGQLIACGTPEEIVKNSASYTGSYLKRLIKD